MNGGYLIDLIVALEKLCGYEDYAISLNDWKKIADNLVIYAEVLVEQELDKRGEGAPHIERRLKVNSVR